MKLDLSTDPCLLPVHSCGLLGLLHMLLLHEHNASNAAKLYRLSRSDRQEFPLAVVSLNITKWTLQVIQAGVVASSHPLFCPFRLPLKSGA